MAQSNQALKVALAAVEQLPIKLQRKLAEQVLLATAGKEETITVQFRCLPAALQFRLTELMDKHTEGQLSPAERAELRRLNDEVNKLMVANSRALARAMRPELFDAKGQPKKRAIQAALQAEALPYTQQKIKK